MENKSTPHSVEPADEISHDIDALRDLEEPDWRLGWSRQFAMILILVSAFVVIVWLGAIRTDSGKPVIFNAGVTVGENFNDRVGGAAATH